MLVVAGAHDLVTSNSNRTGIILQAERGALVAFDGYAQSKLQKAASVSQTKLTGH